MKTWLFILLSCISLNSQTLNGRVTSRESGEKIANCNISIVGTTRGTISNLDGEYSLNLESGRYKILFQHIGFKTDTLAVTINKTNPIHNISLVPQALSMDKIYVYPDIYSEAEQLILRASREKSRASELLQNYSCKSYTKTTMSGLEDSLRDRYALIYETYSDVFWKKPDNWNEIVHSQKITANMPESLTFLSGNTFLDINADLISLGGKQILGPTSPTAIDYYNFEILDTLYQDKYRIFKLSISPKNHHMPLMTGEVYLVDKLYIIQKLDISLNENCNYGLFENIHIVQNYNSFGDSIFIPYLSTWESAFIVSIPGYPKLFYRKTNFREAYNVNREDINKFRSGTNIVFENALPFKSTPMNIPPLSIAEKRGYQFIDSVVTHNLAINLMVNSLKLVDFFSYIKTLPIGDINDFYRYNKIEGNYLGIALNTLDYLNPFRLKIGFGNGFSDDRRKYFFQPGLDFDLKNIPFSFSYSNYNSIRTRENQIELPIWYNTVYSISSGFDYFDYYYAKGSSIGLQANPAPFTFSVSLFNETHKNAFKNTSYSLFNKNSFEENILVSRGKSAGYNVMLKYSNAPYSKSNISNRRIPNRNYFESVLRYESAGSYFDSDFTYERCNLVLYSQSNTFSKGLLDLKLDIGFGNSNLPLQKHFELESGFSGYDRFKTFRTLALNSFTGTRKLALFLEHNFHNSLFQMTQLPFVRDLKYDLLFIYNIGWAGNHKLSWLTYNHLYPEAGFAIGRIFNLFKLEFVWRIKTRMDLSPFQLDLKMIEFEL